MKVSMLAFGMPGTWEWLVILVVALLIFGRRLPDVARSLGKSIVEFKKGMHEVHSSLDDAARLEPPRQQSSTTGIKPAEPEERS